MRSGSLLIEATRPKQARIILDTTTFMDIEVKATPHRSLNTSKGVIRDHGRDLRMEQKKKNNTFSQMLLDHCYTFGLLLWPSNSEEVVLWRRALIDLLWPCPGSTTVRIWPNSQYKCTGVMSTPKCL